MTSDVYRIACYEALRPFFERQKGVRAAEVSGRALVDEFGYPGDTEILGRPGFDLMDPGHALLRAGSFGLVFADFVLEHVPDPRLAVGNLWRLLAVDGWAVVTTDFLFPIHDDETHGDYFRFSPRALRSLFSEGWVDVDVGQWGNREALGYVVGWPVNNRDPRLWHLAGINEDDVPIIVWVRARKAGPQSGGAGRASVRSVA